MVLALIFEAGACAGTNQRPTGGTGTGGGAAGRDGGGTIVDVPAVADVSVEIAVNDGRVIGSDALADAACATATQRAQQVPLDIYVMMDSSGSMTDVIAPNSTTTKWDAVRDAVIAFLQDPQSAGIGVGLQYFPLTQPNVPDTCETDNNCNGFGPCDIIRTCSLTPTIKTCATNSDCARGEGTCVRLGVCGVSNGYCSPAGQQYSCSSAAGDGCIPIAGYCRLRDRCDNASYSAPAVEVAALPGAATALVASLNRKMPDGLTPTAGALSGAILHAQALARANPTHKVVVLLATDGLPSECDPNDIAGVAAIASGAQAGTPPISTYVIGVFAPAEMAGAQMNLDTLAAAGGTGKAFVVSTGTANVTQAFVSALNSVRSSGLSCQYEVPKATGDGGQIDYFAVNVQFTSGSGQAITVGNVKDHASCSATKGGWYYDVDPMGGTPQTISICDTSCAQMKADPAGRIDILLGCTTVIIVD
jgi:Mg-chelatase subunit ChlD